MKIGIYGGSFNPIHKGHIAVAEEAIKELNLDKLYFVPAYKSPFKSKEVYAPAEDRVNMINLVKPEKSEVSMFEINRKGISYTIETLRYIKSKHPEDELYILIGSDNLYKLHKWRDIEEIAQIAQIVVFRREGEFSKEIIKRFNARLLNNQLFNYSSTAFRNGFLENVDPKVQSYIGSHYLYIKELMIAMLDNKRHKHSTSVADFAAKYAKLAGASAKKAWVAGCLHDITKSWPKEKHREFLASKGINEVDVKDYQLHSLSGYYWIKEEYKLEDEEILNSVLRHTSLAEELTQLDKVIFAADKLCEGRRWEGIQQDRELILKDFEQGFRHLVKVIFDLLESERDITPEAKAIFERWM